jgi:hypothetical protein
MVNFGGVGLIGAVAAILLVTGFRRRGRARALCIVLAVAVLVGGFWYELVRATAPLAAQESTAAGQAAKGLPTVSSAASSSAVPTSAVSPSALPDGAVWQGRVTITPSAGLRLDSVPPTAGQGGDYDVTVGTSAQDQISGSKTSQYGNLASWTKSTPPSEEDCLAQMMSSPQPKLTVHPGTIVCVQTASGGFAVLTFVSVTGDHGADVAQATLWWQ